MLVHYTDYTSQFSFKTLSAINDKNFYLRQRNTYEATKSIVTFIFKYKFTWYLRRTEIFVRIIWICITNVVGQNSVASTD